MSGADSEEAAAHQVADFQLDHLARGRIDQVALGQGNQAVLEAEQPEDFQVFAGLRHDAVVGRDHQQGEVDAGGAGEHVLDETLVAGHVHDADVVRGQIEAGEADVDGDAARLLFRQAIAIDAGQGLDQGGLAVIDVARGAQDQIACHARDPPRGKHPNTQ